MMSKPKSVAPRANPKETLRLKRGLSKKRYLKRHFLNLIDESVGA